MEDPKPISPTLAKFLNVPYHTKLNEEDIICSIWDYLIKKRLFIDGRTLLLDKKILPVFHPPFYWSAQRNQNIEHSIVLFYIAKMHMDPDFIERDRHDRLNKIAKNIAARKIINFLGKNKGKKCTQDQLWIQYLMDHYGGNAHSPNGHNGHNGGSHNHNGYGNHQYE
jgi:hypothetical protein